MQHLTADFRKLNWVLVFSLLFVAVNTLLTAYEFYYLNLLPFVLILAYIALTRLDTLLLIVTFFIPLSIPLKSINKGLPFDFFIPTEPLLFLVLLLFMYKYFLKHHMDKRVLTHPVTLAIFFNLAWIFITSITSTMPLVSFKFFLSRLWFVVPFFFLGTQMFRKTPNIKKFIWAYAITLLVVIVYTISRHLGYGLHDKQASHFVMYPFYKDHTVYGAVLAMYIPVIFGFALQKSKNLSLKVFTWLVVFILIGAVILSYSRAAWVSLAAGLAVLFVIVMRIKFSFILVGVLAIFGILMMYRVEIQHKLEKNNQDSSAKISEHMQSISNISTDASNLERLNRWNCAFRMFKEKPIFGWGPGTYMFQYAPFQLSRDKTIISTNAGDLGNAHSEYIGSLSESGLLGALSFIFIGITVLLTGIRVYYRSQGNFSKIMGITTLMGLITYFVHGTLNNFLDTDKASIPFWGFIAILVALDLYHEDKKEPKKEIKTPGE